MKISTVRTHKITIKDQSVFTILDQYVPELSESSVLAVSSKIISLTEGWVSKGNKDELIEQEADLFLPPSSNRYPFYLTIKNNTLIPSAGIDESNGNGYLILWPKNPQQTANQIREYLVKKFKLKKLGVIITDSTVTPLKWGPTGFCLAHSGFLGLVNLIGKKDLFGKVFTSTKVNVMNGLAAAAVVCMGESTEQTPLAIITDADFVQFQDRNPSEEELKDLVIDLEDDLYASILTAVKWRKSSKKQAFAPSSGRGELRSKK